MRYWSGPPGWTGLRYRGTGCYHLVPWYSSVPLPGGQCVEVAECAEDVLRLQECAFPSSFVVRWIYLDILEEHLQGIEDNVEAVEVELYVGWLELS